MREFGIKTKLIRLTLTNVRRQVEAPGSISRPFSINVARKVRRSSVGSAPWAKLTEYHDLSDAVATIEMCCGRGFHEVEMLSVGRWLLGPVVINDIPVVQRGSTTLHDRKIIFNFEKHIRSK